MSNCTQDSAFLTWIHDRLINIHHENPNVDYLHRLRAIIAATPDDQATPNTPSVATTHEGIALDSVADTDGSVRPSDHDTLGQRRIKLMQQLVAELDKGNISTHEVECIEARIAVLLNPTPSLIHRGLSPETIYAVQEAAVAKYAASSNDDIEFDDNCRVHAVEGGYWVEAKVWIRDSEV